MSTDNVKEVTATEASAPAPVQGKGPRAPWYHPWGLFKLTVRTLVYAPLTLLILVALILGTGFGARTAISLAVKFVPNLQATYVEGTLNRELRLADVAWSMDGISVAAAKVHLGWQPGCLLAKRLCVSALALDSVKVGIDTSALPPGEPTSEPATGPIKLPFAITLEQGSLTDVAVTLDNMAFGVSQLALAAEWEDTLSITKLDSSGLSVLIPGDTAQDGAAQIASTPDTATQDDTNPPADKEASSSGNETKADWPLAKLPTVVIPLAIQIDNARLADNSLDIAGHAERITLLELQGLIKDSHINLAKLNLTHPEANLQLAGSIDLSDNYPLDIQLNANADSPKLLPELGKQQIRLQAKGSMSALELALEGSGTLALSLTGSAKPADPEVPFSLKLDLAHAGWPLNAPEYLAQDLSLTANGSLTSQEANVSGKITTPFHAPLSLLTKLSHAGGKLSIAELSIDGDLGKLALDGQLEYGDSLSWQANVGIEQLTPSKLIMPEGSAPLPLGSLSGHIVNSGKLDLSTPETHWDIHIDESDIQGELDGFPLSAKGSVSVNDQLHLSARDFEVAVLGANLVLNGETNQQWAFLGELHAPDLSTLGRDFDGAFNARFEVTGAQNSPQISLNAKGDALELAGVSIANLNINGQYLPLTNHGFSLSAKASEIQLSGRKLASATVDAKGDLRQQSLSATTVGELALRSELQSVFDEKRRVVNATLSTLNLGTELGDWSLSEPMRLGWQIDKAQGQLSAACLNHEFSSLCLARDAQLGKRGDISISYRGEPGKVIDRMLPKNIDWLGKASLDSNVRWSASAKPSGDLSLVLSPGQFTLKRPKGQVVELGYEDLSLTASLTPSTLAADLRLLSDKLASINSHVEVAVGPARTLNGEINLEQINLAPLKEFLPQLDTLEGIISSRLQLGGSLMQPDVSGHLALKNAAFSASSNPTLLEHMDMALNFAGQQATLSGHWMMGSGDGGIDGTLSWPDGNFSGTLNVKGNKLAVIVPPMALLDVSPDLKLTFDSKLLDVKGGVSIPTGHIKIVQLAEGGVAVSSDVVFDDSIADATKQTSPYGVTADLNIRVGDAIRIDGMGLSGKLDGTIRLQQQAFKPPLLFGEVKVVSGSYKFMGQTLKIPKGEVQFVGPPQLPNLNIEAVREIKDEDMVAGVRITGTGMAPQVTLFSNPAKEQAEILSYILKGKGFESNGSGDNNALMMSAALSLSSSLSGGAINNIGSTATSLVESFGFSNVHLDANDDGKVAISGYIGDNLMVKYGVGVFNPGYEMTVRYYLLSQLYLETVSGTLGQSLDIYYNFDL